MGQRGYPEVAPVEPSLHNDPWKQSEPVKDEPEPRREDRFKRDLPDTALIRLQRFRQRLFLRVMASPDHQITHAEQHVGHRNAD